MKPLNLQIELINVQDRLRKDLGDVDELADSLRRYGLIQPIVLDQNNRLIAGERRLRAAQKLGWKEIPVVYRETLTVDELHELELEENYQRKEMTWQERCLSIKVIHTLKSQNAALAGQSWGQTQTAALLGMTSNCAVSYALTVADLIEKKDTAIIECDSMKSALRLLVRRKEDEATKQLVARQLKIAPVRQAPSAEAGLIEDLGAPAQQGEDGDPSKSPQEVMERVIPLSRMFRNVDCISYMKECSEGTFSYIVSDPPYAIDMDNLEQSGSALSDMSAVKEEHKVEDNLALLRAAVPQMCRILRSPGWLVLWTDQQTYPLLQELILAESSMRVQRWPLVWVKSHTCKNEQASKNFTKTVEVAIVAAKGPATLCNSSPTCHWIGSNEDERKESGHPFGKPSGLWEWIYETVCIRGSVVFDPFVGRGSSAIAAIKSGLLPMGCELQETHYAHLIERVRKHYLSFSPNAKFE